MRADGPKGPSAKTTGSLPLKIQMPPFKQTTLTFSKATTEPAFQQIFDFCKENKRKGFRDIKLFWGIANGLNLKLI